MYRLLPLKLLSSIWGKVNNWTVPVMLRKPLFKLYIWSFGCNMEEAAVRDLTHYKNLAEFFRRGLKPGVRPIDQNCSLVIKTSKYIISYYNIEHSEKRI